MSEQTQKQLSPKAAKAMLILLRVASHAIAYGMAAATYAVIGLALTLSLNYGFHLHVRWLGLSAAAFSGMLLSKFILKDVSYAHGKASAEGQIRAQQNVMQKALAIQATQKAQEAEANPFEEEAIRRAIAKFTDGDDGSGGALVPVTPDPSPYL